MKTFDYYGANGLDLESASQLVQTIRGVTLELRDSEYWGGDYYSFGDVGEEHVRVVRNGPQADPDDTPYPDYLGHDIVVEVSCSPHADEYREKLTAAGFEHLRRSTLPG